MLANYYMCFLQACAGRRAHFSSKIYPYQNDKSGYRIYLLYHQLYGLLCLYLSSHFAMAVINHGLLWMAQRQW